MSHKSELRGDWFDYFLYKCMPHCFAKHISPTALDTQCLPICSNTIHNTQFQDCNTFFMFMSTSIKKKKKWGPDPGHVMRTFKRITKHLSLCLQPHHPFNRSISLLLVQATIPWQEAPGRAQALVEASQRELAQIQLITRVVSTKANGDRENCSQQDD